MNCLSCGAPLSADICSYCGTSVTSSTNTNIEIEMTPSLTRLGLEDVAIAIVGDGSDLDKIIQRLAVNVDCFWEASELKKADALVRVFSKRLPRHDKINLMLAKTAYLFGLSTIKNVSTAHIGQGYLREAKKYLNEISDPQYDGEVIALSSKINSTESKKISAFTIWEDDDKEIAEVKQSMESASGCGQILGVSIAVIIGVLIVFGLFQ
jgi:hypothetical protein